MYPPRDIRPFVMYCVNGKPRSSLLIESTDSIESVIESVDSISRDERGFPLTQYITNGRISRAGYTITHFKYHHRVLRLIFYRMSVQHRHNSAVYVRAARSKKSPFWFLILILILLQWTHRDSVLSSDARLHVHPIHFLARRCANGFSVTRPSLNRSFTIKHTVSLPLRRHFVHRVSWQRRSNVIRT